MKKKIKNLITSTNDSIKNLRTAINGSNTGRKKVINAQLQKILKGQLETLEKSHNLLVQELRTVFSDSSL